MPTKAFNAVLIFVTLLVLAGCHVIAEQNVDLDEPTEQQPAPQPEKPPETPEETPPIEQPDLIQQEIEQMSMTDKLGQMLIIGFDGTELSPSTRELLSNHRIGGVILYSKNMKSARQTTMLINELKSAHRKAGIAGPLLIGTDQEGGRVNRLPPDITAFPSSRTVGDTMDADQARQVGASMGNVLHAIGINIDFAPVLDVNTNPANPVIGDRAFGTTVEAVTETGIAVMRGLKQEGVIPVIKHFPGHGDTELDSHTGLPVVRHGLDRLREVEFAPFAEAIDQGADAVMIAHLLMSELDPERPSSLSPIIIGDYLRSELGFDGVVITDDMTMGAISETMEIGAASVQAVLAGSDIVMVGHDPEQQRSAIAALLAAAQSGELSVETIDQSVYRILKLKQSYALDDDPVAPVDTKELNTHIEAVTQPVP